MPVPTLQKIFSGRTVSPRYETLRRIEEILFPEDAEILDFEPAPRHPSVLRETAPVYGKRRKDDRHILPKKPQGMYTVSDLELLPEEERFELIDGVIFRMEAPTAEHQNLVAFLMHQLYRFSEEEGCDCLVLCAPFDVQLDRDDRTMVQPDVLAICDPDRVTDRRGFGAPDLCIEVLSPSTRSKDQLLKRYKYERAGVREFWAVDPEYKRVYVHLFGEEFGDRAGLHVYSFEESVPVSICGAGHCIDFSKRVPAFLRRRTPQLVETGDGNGNVGEGPRSPEEPEL